MTTLKMEFARTITLALLIADFIGSSSCGPALLAVVPRRPRLGLQVGGDHGSVVHSGYCKFGDLRHPRRPHVLPCDDRILLELG